jgi:predicted nucleotidyltransferase
MPRIIDGDLCACVDILDTPNGRILKTLCDYGFIPGVSSRGSGDVMPNNDVDPETFFLETFDCVAIPAVKKARLTMCESLDSEGLKLRKALTESFNNASEEDKVIMKETLDNLNIDIEEEAPKKILEADDIPWSVDETETLVEEMPADEDADEEETAEVAEEDIAEAEEPTEEVTEEEVSEEKLYSAAELLLSDEFALCVKNRVKDDKNVPFALAREKELEKRLGKEMASLVTSPNSLLAVEYAKACLFFGKRPKLFPIARKGASHDGKPQGEFASGSSIRENISLCGEYCPSDVANDITGGKIIRTDKEKYYSALCQSIFYGEKKDISEICEVPGEYAVKLKKSALECDGFDSFFESLKAKHITDAKLRRMLIYLLTHTKSKELESLPESAMLLAVSDDGAKFIRAYKKSGQDFVILSKLSDIKKLPLCEKERYEKQYLAESLFKKLSVEGF